MVSLTPGSRTTAPNPKPGRANDGSSIIAVGSRNSRLSPPAKPGAPPQSVMPMLEAPPNAANMTGDLLIQ
jgi:hypothetical protein